MKTLLVALALCLSATLAFSQSAAMNGTVTDPTGAAVPAADVAITNVATSAVLKTTTNERGEWTVPALEGGSYRLSISKPGFKTATINRVTMEAGVPATVPVKLEIGQATETVTVNAGAEMVQATTAEVSSTLTGRQVTDLPFASRNAVELMVTQPGTSTPTDPRSSTINGLPKGAINITIDGINTQDNLLKSNDGFFSYIMPSVDSLEEVTLTTSAAGVDSTAQGAAQIKFVTKSGTNQFHGGGFYQIRNDFFNANYYFNNQNGLPRDILHLRQYGAHIGGPILKDKLFFFGNWELFRDPATGAFSRSIAYTPYTQGNYTYADTAGNLHTANLFNIAASGNSTLPAGTRPFVTSVDPIIAQTYSQIAALTSGVTLRSNAGSGDYNSGTYNFQAGGLDARDFYTARLDYNINSKHHLSYTYDYNKYVSNPDLLNNVYQVYPGTGTVLGTNLNAGQRSNRFVGTFSLRSALSARLTNEARAGLNGGSVLFRDTLNDGHFAEWRGYAPTITYGTVTTTTSPSRRNGPYKEVGDNLSYLKGSHQITAGFTWSQVNLWALSVGSESIPRISFGVVTGDPLTTGATAPFNLPANFPGASSSQISSMASAYANLTGRVSSITRQVVLSENTHQYAYNTPAIDRNEEQWWGFYGQDTWRVSPSLTATFGLRWEKEGSWKNLNNTYTNVTIQSLYGVSGVGNLFQPGNTPGITPTYSQLTGANVYNMPAVWAPSAGLAWQLPASQGPLGLLFGRHQGASVLRFGYSISTVREGSEIYQSVYGANQGLKADASVSPTTTAADFGPVGSVLFRDTNLPFRSGLPTTQQYPIPANFTSSLNAFDPNLKMGYVQSWNIGFQRELTRDTVVEVRYTGNHGLKEWRQYNLNEVNTVENGFQSVFFAAQNNLRIARGGNINNLTTNNYGNQGLPGQTAIPFLQTALGTTCCNDSGTAGNLTLGQIGSLASSISSSLPRNQALVAAGYAPNYFVANPAVAGSGGGAFIVTNAGSSYYSSGQVEVRRRLSAGLQVQFNYSLSKSLADGATSSATDSSTPTTLRNLALDKVPDGFDIRHAFKANAIYELPFGPGRHFFSSVRNRAFKKALEGWEMAGVMRIQSGTPLTWSSFSTFNNSANGVVYHNITQQQLQGMVNITKTQNPVSGVPQVYYLPVPIAPTGLTSANNTNFITNTQAAFNVNNLQPGQVDPNAPYIGPAAAGQMGCRCYIYLPWQRHIDVSLIKVTHLRESVTLEFRAQALNVFNLTNFLPGSNIGTSFGQVTSAYRDISGTYDPGGRILEFVGRINF